MLRPQAWNGQGRSTAAFEGYAQPFHANSPRMLAKVPSAEKFVVPSAFGMNVCIRWDRLLSGQRAHVTIKAITRKYPHYFRAMCETHYGRIFRTNWALKDFMS